MDNDFGKPQVKDDYGVASMVLGILGTVGIASLICGILAVTLGFMQRKANKNGYSTAGIVLGFVSLGYAAVKIFLVIFYYAFFLMLFAGFLL